MFVWIKMAINQNEQQKKKLAIKSTFYFILKLLLYVLVSVWA